MQMSVKDLIQQLPPPPVIRQVIHGRFTIPQDQPRKAIYQTQVALIEMREQARSAKQANQNSSLPPTRAGSPSFDVNAAYAQQDMLASPAESGIDGKEKQVLADLQVTSIVNLPPERRMAKLLAMQPLEIINFYRDLAPEERAAFVDGLTLQQAQSFSAMQNPVRTVASQLEATKMLRVVAVSTDVPRTLVGRVPAVALKNIGDFRQLDTFDRNSNDPFQEMYDASSNTAIRGAGKEAFRAMQMLRSSSPAKYVPAARANYPGSPFGQSLRQIAQLMKSNYGVEAAFADVEGWDHHHNEGGVQGQLANRLRDFSLSLAAFWTDLGDEAENTVVVTMSEFGRTARQNGTGGTDHGHANAMFVMGGPVRGGQVYGRWPGLENEQLYENRDLAVTTDFRQVLGEAAYKTIGAEDLARVFPNSGIGRGKFLNVIA